ncbi:MAG: hypothetical protein IJ566_00880 [Cardiobacteriaceae bacterium]|nr:hypothetical protein [Cardiobacteriaceae bacterium]
MKNKKTLRNLFASMGIALLCANAAAEVFVGIGGDLTYSKLKDRQNQTILEIPAYGNAAAVNHTSDKNSVSGSRLGWNAKVGYDFFQYRAYLSYQYNSKTKETYWGDLWFDDGSKKWKSQDYIIGADYTPSFNERWKGLFGVYLGKSSLKLGGDYSYKTSGFLYGAKIGGIYNIDQRQALEMGFKLDRTSYKAKDIYSYGYATPTSNFTIHNSSKLKTNNYGLFLNYTYSFN